MDYVAKFNVVKLDWYGQNNASEHKTAVIWVGGVVPAFTMWSAVLAGPDKPWP